MSDPKTNDIVDTSIARDENQKTMDDAVSQVMLGILERFFKTLVEKTKIVKESNRLECEKEKRNKE